MKFNYPVKYAAMPIIEQCSVVGYIVSKCYLLKDSIRYKEDGISVKEFEVVFPYRIKNYNIWERVEPRYSIIGFCENSSITDFVSDSYEEASRKVLLENKNLFVNFCEYLSGEDQEEAIRKAKDNFFEKMAIYKMLEQQISMHTEDIEPKEVKKISRVERFENSGVRILPFTIYQALELFNYDSFVVYTVSPEQYNKLKTLDKIKSLSDIESIIGYTKGLLIHKFHNSVINSENTEIKWFYYGNDGRRLQNVLGYSEDVSQVDKVRLEKILKDEKTMVLYTTETIADLFESYQRHEDIDLMKVQGPILKRDLW